MTTLTAPSSSTSCPRFHVLVVDDDPWMLNSLSSVLGDDVQVVTAISPFRALEYLKARSFHVVCSDFKMPGMNGLELLQKVSQLPIYVSCLLFTGSDEYRSGEGNRHYVLLKPFDPERLIGIVLQLARVAEMKRSVGLLGTTMRGKAGAAR